MTERYKESNKIGTYSCDSNKIAKLSGLLQITQDAGSRQMATQKPSYDDLLADGKAMMLSRLDMKIYDTIRFEEPLTVYSWPCESSKATFLRRYVIERNGEMVVDVASQWAYVELESRKILRVDELDQSNYFIGEYNELYPDKLKLPRDIQLEEVGSYKVGYTDLDYNGHMNNTYYADMLSNHIPELADGTHRIASFRVHYNKEAPLGDVITVMRYKKDDGDYLFKTVKASGEVNIVAQIGLEKL